MYKYKKMTTEDGRTYRLPENNPRHVRRDHSTRYLFWRLWQLKYGLPIPDGKTGLCPGFAEVLKKHIADW